MDIQRLAHECNAPIVRNRKARTQSHNQPLPKARDCSD
jgi:hypothetical protein